jgi:hypothetical protein
VTVASFAGRDFEEGVERAERDCAGHNEDHGQDEQDDTQDTLDKSAEIQYYEECCQDKADDAINSAHVFVEFHVNSPLVFMK